MSRSTAFKSLFLSLSVAALSACSSGGGEVKTSAPMPPISEMDAAMAEPVPTPLLLSESDTLTPVGAVAAAPVSAAMDASSVNARISALEQAVGALRAEYNRMLPAFSNLNTTNERVQVLLDQVEAENARMNGVAASAPVAAAAPTLAAPPLSSYKAPVPEDDSVLTPGAVSKPEIVPAPVVAAKAPVPASAPVPTPAPKAEPAIQGKPGSSITGLRIGEHGAKTRIVFDTTAKTKPAFKFDIDNAEKVLLVDLPSSIWTGAPSGTPSSPMISAWNAQVTSAGGSVIAVLLKKNARIVGTEFLKPEGKNSGRVVIDIAAE